MYWGWLADDLDESCPHNCIGWRGMDLGWSVVYVGIIGNSVHSNISFFGFIMIGDWFSREYVEYPDPICKEAFIATG